MYMHVFLHKDAHQAHNDLHVCFFSLFGFLCLLQNTYSTYSVFLNKKEHIINFVTKHSYPATHAFVSMFTLIIKYFKPFKASLLSNADPL